MSLKALAASTLLRKVTWREGIKGKLSGRFAWLRVWPGGGWATSECSGSGPVWLLTEGQADGEIKYALSNLAARTSRIRAVRLWKSRWPVEKDQTDSTSSDRWCAAADTGYHRCRRAARAGCVVPKAPASVSKKGVLALEYGYQASLLDRPDRRPVGERRLGDEPQVFDDGAGLTRPASTRKFAGTGVHHRDEFSIIHQVESRNDAVADAPFPLPAHRTGRADFPHPALGQELTPSPTESFEVDHSGG